MNFVRQLGSRCSSAPLHTVRVLQALVCMAMMIFSTQLHAGAVIFAFAFEEGKLSRAENLS